MQRYVLTDERLATQVVAMVTEQSMRPELPTADMLPGGSFAGYDEYVELMHSCWHQVSSRDFLACGRPR